MQQSKNKSQVVEIIPEDSSETIPDSVIKKFFIEVSSLITFTLRFFREVLKPPYEFNELFKVQVDFDRHILHIHRISPFPRTYRRKTPKPGLIGCGV